ncbi:MAG: PilT/PilU family type 4a pilus ATPase [Planctomycetota bacterium]|nr:PilT/PilU family type 4a pilus ATPase [Planctomycetota bacterium]
MGRYFEAAIRHGASDLLLTAGVPPCARVNGDIVHFDAAPLSAGDVRRLVYSVLRQDQIARFEEKLELDFSIAYRDTVRFRGNVYRQRGCVAAAFRMIPSRIPTLTELGLPPVLEEFALLPHGLILVTGPTGHGKSTTQAAMLDIINRERRCHIVTIEDPIEYLHFSKKSVIDQREVGEDTHSFADALRHVLRQDPNVIQIGEMRDLETISTALTAAETGHLVLATLHTNSAAQSCDRIIDAFPAHQQNQIRVQLSLCLAAIISQRLLPRADGKGRVAAVEILRNQPGVANLIREGKTHMLQTVMETQGRAGMQTMDGALKRLYMEGVISRETAAKYMSNPGMLPGA